MRVLLVAATAPEIQPILSSFAEQEDKMVGKHLVKVLITGAGMVSTAFSLGQHLSQNSYDLAINAGIAGSFDFGIAPGEVCVVKEDTFAELGAEDGDDFLSFDSLGLGMSSHSDIPKPGFSTEGLRAVVAITVNKIHGNELSIAKAMARFNPQIESMEGASFFYACGKSGLPCIQIRAISNYVERRNRENWDIPLAVKNLNDTIINLLER